METHPIRHEHSTDLGTTLDFVNTLERCSTRTHAEYPHGHEALRTLDDAIDFLADRGLGHREDLAASIASTPDAGERWLTRVRDVRAALREVFDAETESRTVDPAAVARINEVLRHRPLIELTPGGDGVGVGHRHVGDPLDEALARLVEPLVDAIARDATARFRICANDECRYVFLDESRTGRRRWCDMRTCGNRAKVARHRARARGAREIQILDA